MALAQTTLELFATFTFQPKNESRNMLISQQRSSGTPTLSYVMVIWGCWVSFLWYIIPANFSVQLFLKYPFLWIILKAP